MTQPTYTCLLCGRNKFTRKTPHWCNRNYRKHGIEWKLNNEEMNIGEFNDSQKLLDILMDFQRHNISLKKAEEDVLKIFNREPLTCERFFMISYLGKQSGATCNGYVTSQNKDGDFPNKKGIEDYLKEMGVSEVVILNVVELSKQDFEDWNK